MYLFSVVLALCGSSGAQKPYALRGTVVTPSGPLPQATILIEGSRIKAIGSNLPLPAGTPLIETNGIIYPGLIDLHDHVTWNALARWSAGAKFGARYDWQQLPEYQMALDVPHRKMVAEDHGCAAERYAEAKAIVGGATSQAGLSRPDLTAPGIPHEPANIPPGCLAGLVRELGVDSRLYPKGTEEKLRYEVFPLTLSEAQDAALLDALKSGKTTAALFHIAEGATQNASARREFAMLKARGLLLPGVSIIHGVALTTSDFDDMAKSGVGLVWSPRSNFELYGSTANVAAAKKAGVKLALAPDWSPTGSDGMLQELKYATIWNATQDPQPFTSRELFEMVTRNAADLGGTAAETGTIEAGKRADLLVIRADPSATSEHAAENDPYATIAHTKLSGVELVIVDGTPVYGDPASMDKLSPKTTLTPLDICGTTKDLAVVSVSRWNRTTSDLEASLHRWGATLSPLTDCH